MHDESSGLEHDRPPSLQEIFLAARELTDDARRERYLSEVTGDDSALRQRIARMLASRQTAQAGPLARAVEQLASTDIGGADHGEIDLSAHPLIGPYKLLEQIGQGGMGSVYMAQQTEPVKRMVALKVIKAGMDSKEVVARFEAERQTLAMMEHPHIAKVFDGGTNDQGRPYFVMELVRGVPITEFCREKKLDLRARIDLFIDACSAVQHAHQKGVIHRDLKPSNLLVTMHDHKAVVKVIDFGVAKALHQELTERTLFTHFSQMIGTPLYMAPEQAQMSGLDIDTRSDIYSLGVVLYELLTGTTPFDRHTLSKLGMDGIRKFLNEQEPARPSVRINKLRGANPSTIDDNLPIDAPNLKIAFCRELDWVVMKAMEKDRNRRYDSAQAFAEDLGRYLRDEPVTAYPPSKLYQMRKLIHRRWRPLLAASLVAMAIIIGGIASTVLAVKATLAEAKAVQAEAAAEERAVEIQRMLYASDLALASRAWQQGDVQGARRRLAQHIPATGEIDLRGFEWHFLWKQQQVQGIEVANLGAAIYDIALSPDGSQFATAGADGIIRGFATESLALQWQIESSQGETNGIAFSPDGTCLAACGDDGTLRLWQLDTFHQTFSVKAHQGMAYQVVFSPDGSIVATCGQDKHVSLWDAHSGEPIGILNQHEAPLETLAISQGGLVAAADEKSGVTVYDIMQRKPVFQFNEPRPESISAISYSSRGDLAYATVAGGLCVRDTRDTWSYRRRLPDGIRSLAFSPNGFSIAVGDQSGNMRLQPVDSGGGDFSSTREWKAHESRIYAVEFLPDGQSVVSGGEDGRIVSWRPFDSASRRMIHAPAICQNIVVVGPDRLALGCEGMVVLCDFSGRILRKIESSEGSWHIHAAVEPGLLVGVTREKIAIWEIETGQRRFAQAHEPGVFVPGSPVIAPDGGTVLYAAHLENGDRELRILDVQTPTKSMRFPVRSALSMDVSPDGRWLAYDSDNDIQLLDLRSRKIAHTWSAHSEGIRDLRFTRDGCLASVSSDRNLKLWSFESGLLLYSVLAHLTEAQRLAIQPNGRIATGGDDRMLRMWDGRSDQALWEISLGTGRARDLEFSMDGTHLFSLCSNYEIQVFDATPTE